MGREYTIDALALAERQFSCPVGWWTWREDIKIEGRVSLFVKGGAENDVMLDRIHLNPDGAEFDDYHDMDFWERDSREENPLGYEWWDDESW